VTAAELFDAYLRGRESNDCHETTIEAVAAWLDGWTDSIDIDRQIKSQIAQWLARLAS
jgi:ribosome modulation factor